MTERVIPFRETPEGQRTHWRIHVREERSRDHACFSYSPHNWPHLTKEEIYVELRKEAHSKAAQYGSARLEEVVETCATLSKFKAEYTTKVAEVACETDPS